MLETVWIKNNIIQSFRNRDNILYFTHKNVINLLGASEDYLVLFEPNGQIGLFLQCSFNIKADGAGKKLSYPDFTLSDLQEGAEDSPVNSAFGCVIPLKADNTSAFGAILIPEDRRKEIPKDGWSVVRAFANTLYNEAMGGFVKSVFPEILTVRNLEVAYQKNIKIIKGIDFDICEKEFTVLLGSSGCGKTTTVNAIGGMLEPTAGEILWNGRNIAGANDRERTAYRRDAIGFIFQHYNLISDLSAKENVNVAASLVNDSLSAEDALDMVGLADKANQYPGKMSGGEQQRVCIARAIAKNPQILLCDEPTGALDPENSLRVIKILKNLVNERHIAVVMITHNTAFRCLADHCITMSAGQIVEDIRQPFPVNADNLQLR